MTLRDGLRQSLGVLVLTFIILECSAADRVVAEHSVVTEGDIRDSTITIGYTAEQVQALIQASTKELKTDYQAQVGDLSLKLNVTTEAVVGFFRILDQAEVPPEKLPERLGEIAQRHREMLDRLAVLEPEDPATRLLIEEARAAIKSADYELADLRLKEAEAKELAAVHMADQLVQQAQEAADRRRVKVAKILAERGELSLTRLNYRQAARHFKAASTQLPPSYPPCVRIDVA